RHHRLVGGAIGADARRRGGYVADVVHRARARRYDARTGLYDVAERVATIPPRLAQDSADERRLDRAADTRHAGKGASVVRADLSADPRPHLRGAPARIVNPSVAFG